MTNVFEDISALVAFGAAFVSALSALYARWQANAAKRANEIALHENRLRVFNSLSRYRVHLTSRGASIAEEEVWRFAEAVELSEFYFPKKIQPMLQGIFDESLKLLSINDEWRAAKEEGSPEATVLVKKRHELAKNLRDECQNNTNELKRFLRVGES